MAQPDTVNTEELSFPITRYSQDSFPIIYFEADKIEIDSAYYPILDKLAERIIREDMKLIFPANADDTGFVWYNIELCEDRKNEVFKYWYTFQLK